MAFFRVAGGRAAETKGGPGKALGEASCTCACIARDFFFKVRVGRCGAAGETVVGAGGVVVAAPCGV